MSYAPVYSSHFAYRCFHRISPQPIKVYWIDKQGERVFNTKLESGERHTNFITTFIGHQFEIYDTQPNEDPLNNEMLYKLTIENNGVVGIKNHEQPHVPREHVEDEVRETLHNEWSRHLMIKRTFSPLGFDKGRLPDDLYASLGSYYYNNRHPPHVVLEEWGRHKGVFVNYWETDVNFVQIPWNLKRRWQGRLKELVEAWTGVELETTDMYGESDFVLLAIPIPRFLRSEYSSSNVTLVCRNEGVYKRSKAADSRG